MLSHLKVEHLSGWVMGVHRKLLHCLQEGDELANKAHTGSGRGHVGRTTGTNMHTSMAI